MYSKRINVIEIQNQTIIQSILVYGAEVWQIRTSEINNILSTEMDVLMRSARKSRMERTKNERIKEISGVKGKPDIIDIKEKKRLKWYGHVKRMPEERIPKLIMEWVPLERRKRGHPRKMWMEGVLDWIGLDGTGLDWIGWDCIRLDWMGLDWIGLNWIGLDGIGLDGTYRV
jgi:hypothetical protein